MRWRWLVLLIAFVTAGGLWYMLRIPGRSHQGPLPPLTERQRAVADALAAHVHALADGIGERSGRSPRSLARAAEYIRAELEKSGYAPQSQLFTVGQQPVENIESELRGREMPEEILLLGAHYDTVPGCPGANDNASGVAALLEIARSLRATPRRRSVRFVAFVNEEPPFFQGSAMGSLQYASRSRERGERILGMLSLETIGWYSSEPGSQQYPPPLAAFYPSQGDFIAFVSNLRSARLLRRVVGSFRQHARFPSQAGALPEALPGVGWSDHWSFWQYGYPAVMVTDTAPFRYPHYHMPDDTPDKLDYPSLARVVEGLTAVARDLGES